MTNAHNKIDVTNALISDYKKEKSIVFLEIYAKHYESAIFIFLSFLYILNDYYL